MLFRSINLVASDAGKLVARYELKESRGLSLCHALRGKVPEVSVFKNDDYFAPMASGSNVAETMVVLPCSMGTLARIANGTSDGLISRAADVVLKQKKRLILCPRETPFNTIHLRNMLTLSEMGAFILPLMPGFYQAPHTISDLVKFMVGHILQTMDIDHDLYRPWGEKHPSLATNFAGLNSQE